MYLLIFYSVDYQSLNCLGTHLKEDIKIKTLKNQLSLKAKL